MVLISGSGAQNRDENIFGFKIFGTIADHLTRNGIAVLRYDDRGIGGSTGDMANATSDFAKDVMAAVDLLKTRPDIDAKRIGLIGHSEGGLIAPMVATRADDVAFVTLLAGPGTSGVDVLREQLMLILKANGATRAQIDQALAEQQRIFDVMLTGKGLMSCWRTGATVPAPRPRLCPKKSASRLATSTSMWSRPCRGSVRCWKARGSSSS